MLIYAENHPCLLISEHQPESSETQEEFLKIIKSSFLVVVICLPPAAEGDSPIPIGSMGLQRDTHVKRIQHRNCSIGIRILRDFRSKGYGTEAVEWALGWAFRRAGLHKVKIGCVGWNTRAGKVYERMGFVQEAVLREELWHDGKWWDQIDMSMLEQEYWAREEERKQKTGVQDGSRVE
jgi:RimJ/RimL family protein N-acetyltransferase